MKWEAENITSISKIFEERDEARGLAEKWRYTAEANGVGEWEWFPWEPDYEQENLANQSISEREGEVDASTNL